MLANHVIFVQDIDTGIHSDTRQENERRKTTLIEIKLEPIERQKHADERYGNDKDNRKRLFNGVEQHRCSKEYNHNQ